MNQPRALPLAVLIASQIARARVETGHNSGWRRDTIGGLCLRRLNATIIAPDQTGAGDDQQDRPYTMKQIGDPKIQHRDRADAYQQYAEHVHALLQENLQPFVFGAEVFASAQTLRRLECVVDRIKVETGAP